MKTCTIGCKLPNGLIIEIGKPGDPNYRQQKLNGKNSALVIGGYGLTENVDEALFDAWAEKNKLLSFMRQGLIFKQKNTDEAKAQAIDTADKRTGLEPLNPKDMPKGLAADKDHANSKLVKAA
jgi:hypothetical protein